MSERVNRIVKALAVELGNFITTTPDCDERDIERALVEVGLLDVLELIVHPGAIAAFSLGPEPRPLSYLALLEMMERRLGLESLAGEVEG